MRVSGPVHVHGPCDDPLPVDRVAYETPPCWRRAMATIGRGAGNVALIVGPEGNLRQMLDNGLLRRLTDYVESIGYEVVVEDSSNSDGGLEPSLIFVRAPEGALYSINVERVG